MNSILGKGAGVILLLGTLVSCSQNATHSGPSMGIDWVNIATATTAIIQQWKNLQFAAEPTLLRTVSVGQNTASGLQSLKYYIRSIQICEDLTISGTSYSGASGCLTLYDADSDSDYDYTAGGDYSSLADVARSDTTHFTDLMSPTSIGSLATATTLSSNHVREYNWGLITWYPPVKVKGTVIVNDGTSEGTTFRTRDGTTTFVSSTYFTTTSSTAFTSGTVGEAVVVMTNGGTWFRFQNPLSITADDIESRAEYTLKLAFNPTGLLKGFQSSSRNLALVDNGGRGINIPFLDLSPIAHKSNQTVTREAYTLTHTATTDKFDVRLDLYYLSNDPAKTIYAVEAKTLYRRDTGTNPTVTDVQDFPKISYVSTNGDGTLDFKIYDESVILDNFTRKTTAGDTGSVYLNCESTGMTFSGCTAGQNASLSYTLNSISVLD